ncbi:hypothetical protein BG015_005764 [Linnemannia schmuckeri]|uniref:Uncharacterized protein n=1 Tax=Linnemannia schmuckeri TaxID=64567 RepID=A0A9P5VC68_9FUNG|nr:hypothetical protein BG015_005764 [Linnemannia schmuckeri]
MIQALEACIHLRSLEIQTPRSDSLRLLAAALKTGLPNLDTIGIINKLGDIPDEDNADMLSAGRKGWRSIRIWKAGPLTADVVIKHCSTLESLCMQEAAGLTSAHMLQVLSSSPKLESFITLVEDGDEYYEYVKNENTHIAAEDIIDADLMSSFLKSWACESTLKIFRAKISGIPRAEITQTFSKRPLKEGMVIQETYPGQSLDIQGRVYDRLARLTRLERLGLGNEDRDLNNDIRHNFPRQEEQEEIDELDDDYQQYDCLGLSLQSGLWELKGLKELKVLSVARMTTRIGPEEKRWIRLNWLRIERLELGGHKDVEYLE